MQCNSDGLSALLASLDRESPRAAIQAIDAYRQEAAAGGALEQELGCLAGHFSALVINALLEQEAEFMSSSYHAELCCRTVERSDFHDCAHRWRDPGPVHDEIDKICRRLQGRSPSQQS